MATDMLAVQQELDLLTTGLWHGESWKPYSNRSLDKISACTLSWNHPQHHQWWVHVIGDSVARYLFAAWLTHFNGTVRDERFPKHEMHDDPNCSFAVTTRNGSRGMAREGRHTCASAYLPGHVRVRLVASGLAETGRRTQTLWHMDGTGLYHSRTGTLQGTRKTTRMRAHGQWLASSC